MSLFSATGSANPYGSGSTLGTAYSAPSAGQSQPIQAGVGLFAPVAQYGSAIQSGVSAVGQAGAYQASLQNGYQTGMLNNAGTLAGLQLQSNLGGASLVNYGAQYDNQRQADQDTYNNQVASNNLNAIGNLQQQAAIPRQIAYTDATFGNQAGRYGDQTNYINAQYGYNDQDLAQTTGYLGTSGTLADQLMGIQNQGANITDQDALRNARYTTEASGAGTTAAAYGANLGSANATYQNALAGNANTNAGTHNSLNYQQSQATLNHTEKAADLGDQQSALNYGINQDNLDAKEKDAQSGDELGQLKLAGAQLGLNADALKSGLDHAITSLNLQGQMTTAQILTDLGSNNAQKAQLAANIVQQAIPAATKVAAASGKIQG